MALASQTDQDNAKLRLMACSSNIREMIVVPKEISDAYRFAHDDTDITMSNTDDNSNDTSLAMNAGKLERFPLEILIEILSMLDIKSVFKMRSVSRYMKRVIDQTMTSYYHSAKHAPDALAAMHRTGMAEHFTMKDFSNALYSTTCVDCGHYGQFLYLLTCTRHCHPCFTSSPKYFPLFKGVARVKYGLDNKTVNELPTLRSIPGEYASSSRPVQVFPTLRTINGVYASDRKKYKRIFNLVDQVSAYNAGIKLHGSLEAMRNHVKDPPQGDWISTTTTPKGMYSIKYMVSIFFPSFNPTTQIVERGLCCVPCMRICRYNYHVSERAFTQREFLENHFHTCDSLQEIWNCYHGKRFPARGYVVK